MAPQEPLADSVTLEQVAAMAAPSKKPPSLFGPDSIFAAGADPNPNSPTFNFPPNYGRATVGGLL